MPAVLVIDEARDVLRAYEETFQARGRVGVFTAPTLSHARAVLSEERVCVVIIDLELEGADTVAFIEELGRTRAGLAVVAVTRAPGGERCAGLEARGLLARVIRKPCSHGWLHDDLEQRGFFASPVVPPPAAPPPAAPAPGSPQRRRPSLTGIALELEELAVEQPLAGPPWWQRPGARTGLALAAALAVFVLVWRLAR